MNKEEILNDLRRAVYCRLKASSVQGVGVFAVRDIPKDINPFPNPESNDVVVIPGKEIFEDSAIPLEVKRMVWDFCSQDENGNVDMPTYPLGRLEISYYVNHSETPNLVLYFDTALDDYAFRTLHDIQNGEELTADYREYSKDIYPRP